MNGGRRWQGLPLGSRRRTVWLVVALTAILLVGAILAIIERPPDETIASVRALIEEGHDAEAMTDEASRDLDDGLDDVDEAVEQERWEDALASVDSLRDVLRHHYDTGGIEAGVARAIDFRIDDLETAIRHQR